VTVNIVFSGLPNGGVLPTILYGKVLGGAKGIPGQDSDDFFQYPNDGLYAMVPRLRIHRAVTR
jgi:hypothetical protein